MTKSVSEPQSNNLSEKDLEDLRNAFQTLPQMIAHEGQKTWNAISVFFQLTFVLASGAIVPSFVPESSSNKIILPIVGIILSSLGVASAYIWINLDKRYRKITRYWVLSMRDLEDKLSGSLNAFQRGKEFSEGGKVIVSGEPVSYENLENISERTGFRIVYFVIGIVFIFLFCLNVYRLIVAL